MNDEKQFEQQNPNTTPEHPDHPVATGIGAVGGGVAGGAIGKAVGGRVGAALGAVAGAIAGGIVGNAVGELTEEVSQTLGLGLGANTKPIELPKHYSWDELRALSKPQLNESAHHSN